MKIEKLKIVKFKNCENMTVEISEKINVLPTSLSTVLNFITFLLFGFTEAERDEYISDTTPTCEGWMLINSNEKRYVISRRDMLSRDPKVPCIATLVDKNTDKELFSAESMGERLLGVNREVFRNSCILRSFPDDYDMSGLTVDTENSLMLADGQLNFQYALTLTDNDRAASRDGGRIDTLKEEISSRASAIADAERAYARVYELRDKIYGKEGELALLCAEREDASRLEQLARSARVIEDFDRLHDMEDLRREQTLDIEHYREKNGYKGFCPDEEYRRKVALAYKGFREANARYNNSVNQYCKFNEEHSVDKSTEEIARRAEALGGVEKVQMRYNEAHTSHRVLMWCSFASLAALILILFWGFATDSIGRTPAYYVLWATSLFLSLAGVLTLAFFARKYKLISLNMAQEFGAKAQEELQTVMRRIEEMKKAVKVRMQTLHAINTECTLSKELCDRALSAFKNAIEEWGASLPSSEIDEFMYDFDIKIEAYINEETALIDRLRKTEQDIYTARRRLSAYDEIAVRAKVKPALRQEYRAMDYESLEDNLSRLVYECSVLGSEIDALKEELSTLTDGTPSVSALREEIAERRALISSLETRAEDAVLAQDMLSDAEREIRLILSPKIAARATEVISGATPMGSPADTSPAAPERKDNFEGDRQLLERTPRGIAYIAMKAALVSAIFKEGFPLMLALEGALPQPAVKQILRASASVIANGGQVLILADGFNDTTAEFNDKIKHFKVPREVKA